MKSIASPNRSSPAAGFAGNPVTNGGPARMVDGSGAQFLNPQLGQPKELGWAVDTHPVLLAIEAEYQALRDSLSGLRVRLATGVAADESSFERHLNALRTHLFLTLSQLWPMWRGLCVNGRRVDQTEVKLAQLCRLVDHVLDSGLEGPMTEASLAVVEEDLNRHGECLLPLLRALHYLADRGSLDQLLSIWVAEQAAVHSTLARGERPVFDNESGDPVGRAYP